MTAEDLFGKILDDMKKVFNIKNKDYGNSFLSSDLSASFYDIRRKWKRIEQLFKEGRVHQVTEFDADLSSVEQNLIDLANYAVLSILNLKKIVLSRRLEKNISKQIKIIAVDFDGTIADYVGDKRGIENYGKVIEGAKKALAKFKAEGHVIIIYSCRNEVEDIRTYLNDNDIIYDYINYSPRNDSQFHSGKPVADIYIDDKALVFKGVWDEQFVEEVLFFVPWHKRNK